LFFVTPCFGKRRSFLCKVPPPTVLSRE
jgi:hypothetical protein